MSSVYSPQCVSLVSQNRSLQNDCMKRDHSMYLSDACYLLDQICTVEDDTVDA